MVSNPTLLLLCVYVQYVPLFWSMHVDEMAIKGLLEQSQQQDGSFTILCIASGPYSWAAIATSTISSSSPRDLLICLLHRVTSSLS
jgi:hypothetical protein